MRRVAAFLAMATACAAGCGPVQTTRALSAADREIAATVAAGADQASPYEHESALRYRDRAREREGRADYQQARDWARKAAAFAVEARTKADENRRLQAVRARAAARAGGTAAPESPAPDAIAPADAGAPRGPTPEAPPSPAAPKPEGGTP
jgi:hypothetical protein